MSKVISEPRPRYVVEIANGITSHGWRGVSRYAGAWNFAHAFPALSDAESMAARMAEENEFVRIVDRAYA